MKKKWVVVLQYSYSYEKINSVGLQELGAVPYSYLAIIVNDNERGLPALRPL